MQYYYESNADYANYCYLKRQSHPFAEEHFHSACEMILVKSGKMLATIDGQEHVVHSGQGCFVDKLTLHSYRELSANTEVYVLVGDSALWATVFKQLCGKPTIIFSYDDYAVIDNAVGLYDLENARLSAFQGAISLICAKIITRGNPKVNAEKSGKFNISAILFFIDEHFREDISLTRLSAHFGYSPQYLSKIFNRHMHVGLSEYVNSKRVGYANAMLDTDKSIVEIAEESGFNSVVSFYRAYKRAFGKLPRD